MTYLIFLLYGPGVHLTVRIRSMTDGSRDDPAFLQDLLLSGALFKAASS